MVDRFLSWMMAQLEQQEFVSNCCYFLCDTPVIRFEIGLEIVMLSAARFYTFQIRKKNLNLLDYSL